MPPEDGRSIITGATVASVFVEKGWEIRYRGGNAICSTPSDMEMTVADAPEAEGGTPRARPRYSIAAWPVSDGPGGEPRPPLLDLYDAERDVEMRVDHVPTPEQAARLLARHATGEAPVRY